MLYVSGVKGYSVGSKKHHYFRDGIVVDIDKDNWMVNGVDVPKKFIKKRLFGGYKIKGIRDEIKVNGVVFNRIGNNVYVDGHYIAQAQDDQEFGYGATSDGVTISASDEGVNISGDNNGTIIVNSKRIKENEKKDKKGVSQKIKAGIFKTQKNKGRRTHIISGLDEGVNISGDNSGTIIVNSKRIKENEKKDKKDVSQKIKAGIFKTQKNYVSRTYVNGELVEERFSEDEDSDFEDGAEGSGLDVGAFVKGIFDTIGKGKIKNKDTHVQACRRTVCQNNSFSFCGIVVNNKTISGEPADYTLEQLQKIGIKRIKPYGENGVKIRKGLTTVIATDGVRVDGKVYNAEQLIQLLIESEDSSQKD